MIVVPLALIVWMVIYERTNLAETRVFPSGVGFQSHRSPHANTVPEFTTAEGPRC